VAASSATFCVSAGSGRWRQPTVRRVFTSSGRDGSSGTFHIGRGVERRTKRRCFVSTAEKSAGACD
jgi:hypothetical protein